MDRARVAPKPLPFHFLEEITDGFSEKHILGVGAYGSVYKGQGKDGEKIAIKKLHSRPGLNDEQFEKEYLNLASLQHQNIVRLLGYSHETRKEWIELPGKTVFAEIQHMALCFEYMCNGSLANYLQDELTGEEWHTRYAIIKGICNGLKYLHEELNPSVFHLDLKPDNILLDEKMTPKIADFGLSKLFADGRTRVSASPIGTLGYLPPEYFNGHIISNKLDIFSLGVIIIQLMTGSDGYTQAADLPSEQFIELTHGKWRKRLQRTSNDVVELYAEQVKTCIKIALSCVEADRSKRPTIGDIVSELDHTETTAQFSHALTLNRGLTAVEEESELVDELEGELLNVHPRHLRFPFFEPNKSISCSLRLSNNTDVDVAFRVLPRLPEEYIDGLSKLSGIVPPRFTHTFLIWMEKQPPVNLDKFDVTLESCIANSEVADVDDNFIPDILELTEGNKVHEVTLTATICDPDGEKMTSEPIRQQTKIICSIIERQHHVTAMDTHPTEPWILVGHYDGSISVWNYETQARLMEFNAVSGPVRSAKFVGRKQWIVACGNYGQIIVHSCVTMDEIKKFQPLSSWVGSVAVHPNLPLLLSASEGLIKLWDWEKGWMCLRTFKNINNTLSETIMFNPNNDSTGNITFTTVSDEGIAKIWKTSHPIPMATCDCKLNGVLCFDYLPHAGGGEYIVIGTYAGDAQVWDLKTQKCVQQITGVQAGYSYYNVGVVDCSPDRPFLVVALQDNTVGLYNPTTRRYENIFMHKFGKIRRLSYIKAIRSVAIAHEGGLAILEIH